MFRRITLLGNAKRGFSKLTAAENARRVYLGVRGEISMLKLAADFVAAILGREGNSLIQHCRFPLFCGFPPMAHAGSAADECLKILFSFSR